jgi:alkylhydroperoxidase family enzyme
VVKIRASQLDHCAFCLDTHTKDAVTVLTGGTSQAFGSGGGFVPGEVYERFDEAELSRLIAATTVINAWNRFGVTCRMAPGHYQPGQRH